MATPISQRDRDRTGDRGGEAEIVGQQQRHDHADEARDRADRQIDAAGDDDEGLADREDRDHSALAQQIGDVVRGPERRVSIDSTSHMRSSRPSRVRPSSTVSRAPAFGALEIV